MDDGLPWIGNSILRRNGVGVHNRMGGMTWIQMVGGGRKLDPVTDWKGYWTIRLSTLSWKPMAAASRPRSRGKGGNVIGRAQHQLRWEERDGGRDGGRGTRKKEEKRTGWRGRLDRE